MSPKSFYENRIGELQSIVAVSKRNLRMISALRLFVFLTIAILEYSFWGQWIVMAFIFILGMPLFLFLVSKYENLKNRLRFQNLQLAINENEVAVINGGINSNDNGAEFLNGEHYYNQDLDLFGERSLFAYLNRTTTREGKIRLATKLNANDILSIQEKQTALEELGKKTIWRQEFSARSKMVNEEVEVQFILNWLINYQPYLKKIQGILPLPFGVLSLCLFGLYFSDVVNINFIVVWLSVGFLIIGSTIARTSKLYLNGSKAQALFKEYAELLHLIESETFESPLLKSIQAEIVTSDNSASNSMKKFSRLIDYLGNRNNIFLSPIINGFFLWDFIFVRKIDEWINNNKFRVESWMHQIHEFDALNSLANYSFNHPQHIRPILVEGTTQIEAVELGHPLISEEKCVKNSVNINTTNFFIITGANMAGKSTFLRTIGLNIVLANNGLPVNAKSFNYKPVKLISSMRTTDSLADDESYFFSELKRLKFIVETIKKDEYFIILDEILKGTNSVDKAEGSKKFVERLVASGSTGLIATHDLSLCELSNQLDPVKNFYFDAEIVNDELYFDYKMKEGICKNMNASFLLRKMNIV